jgi:hypothetical protein
MAGWIINVTKKHGLHLTARNAEWFDSFIHAVGTQGAFPHFVFFGVVGQSVIGTGFKALLAAVAFFFINEHYSVLASIYCIGGARR